jgi:Putative regulator of cell autolysis
MKKAILNINNILWIVIVLILWYQVSRHTSLIEAILITFVIFASIFLINTYLSNYLLPKAIRAKKINLFWGQFIILTFIMAVFWTLILAIFRYFEKIGWFASSTLFSVNDSFLSDFINQMPACLVINFAIVGLRFYQEHSKLERTHLESQLQALKAQINPHFTFNVLNHIHYFIGKKDDFASMLLLKYSDVLRYQLYSGKKDVVRLEDEIQFLKNYIDIEILRWEDKLDISCSWKMNNTTMEIPPLLLITLIENAFKHVSRVSKDRGFIRIGFEQQEHLIYLEVENSKSVSSTKKRDSLGLGIENLKNRLDILYHNKYKLIKIETDDVYFSKLTISTS